MRKSFRKQLFVVLHFCKDHETSVHTDTLQLLLSVNILSFFAPSLNRRTLWVLKVAFPMQESCTLTAVVFSRGDVVGTKLLVGFPLLPVKICTFLKQTWDIA